MSQPTEPINPYDSPETVRPRTSGGTKVLIGLGIGCGVLVLLCCGVLGVGGFFFGRSLNLSEDADTVREVTGEIVTIDVPQALEPKFSLNWVIPFVDRKMMMMAVYADADEHSGLGLFQLDESLGSDREAMELQFKESMRESGGEFSEARLDERETFKTEINGGEAEFTYGRGKLKDKNREVWQATGGFDGKGGPAMLFLQLDADDFTKEDMMGVLESMK